MSKKTILDAMIEQKILLAEKDDVIERLRLALNDCDVEITEQARTNYTLAGKIAELERETKSFRAAIAIHKSLRSTRDLRIAELERELRAFNRPFDDPSGRYDLTNEEWSNDDHNS